VSNASQCQTLLLVSALTAVVGDAFQRSIYEKMFKYELHEVKA
jgi:hypothetical protein